MATVERLTKLREERLAREKARIEKLRELNLKKYNKNDSQNPIKTFSNVSLLSKFNKELESSTTRNVKNTSSTLKNNLNQTVANRTTSAPTSGNIVNNNVSKKSVVQSVYMKSNSNSVFKKPSTETKIGDGEPKKTEVQNNRKSVFNLQTRKNLPVNMSNSVKHAQVERKSIMPAVRSEERLKTKVPRKSILPVVNKAVEVQPKTQMSRKSFVATKIPQSTQATSPMKQNVFERLYKPKQQIKSKISEVEKLKTDPNYLKKVITNSQLIMNKRHTILEPKAKAKFIVPVRRSISAVHLKKISKNELANCIHKYNSIGDHLDKIHLKDVNEDEEVRQDKIISAIKSERKKVKFQTPLNNINTPKPDELQAKLKTWLQKRGKSLDSFHHLQCFGLHLTQTFKPFTPNNALKKLYDEENKENIEVDSESDNDSYTENMNESKSEDIAPLDKWRRVSSITSADLNETSDLTLNSEDMHNVNDLVIGALNDLTELIREGFDWEQSARWLRAIRVRFPSATDTAAYWECRAALEEHRGDLPASVQCWEQAIAKGTEHSVVESNLDQLLDKFMQLKISPNSVKGKVVDSKLVDVKNVFKSTIIRFAVQQAKFHQTNQPKYTVTPVRRSGRLSISRTPMRTPLQECASIRIAEKLAPKPVFVRNQLLVNTP